MREPRIDAGSLYTYDAAQTGKPLHFSISSRDEAKPYTDFSYTAAIDWGDGEVSVVASTQTDVQGANTDSIEFETTHVYAKAGVYRPVVTVRSSDGRYGESSASGTLKIGPVITSNAFWNADDQGLDFYYDVKQQDLVAGSKVAVYYASGWDYASRIGGAVKVLQIGPGNGGKVGWYGAFHLTPDELGEAPPNATRIMVVADPDNTTGTFDYTNVYSANVQSLSLATVTAIAPERDDAGGITYGFSISDADLTFDAGYAYEILYWASGPNPGDAMVAIESQAVTGSTMGPHTFHLTSEKIGTPPTGATHLLVVVEPPYKLLHTAPERKYASLALRDISVTAPVLASDGDRWSFNYTVGGGDLPPGVAVELAWAGGGRIENVIAKTNFSQPTKSAPGTYTVEVPVEELGSAPAGATHLIAIVDPGHKVDSLDHYAASPLSKLAVKTAVWDAAAGGASIELMIDWPGLSDGDPLPAEIPYRVFWSSTPDIDGMLDSPSLSGDRSVSTAGLTSLQVTPEMLSDLPVNANYLVVVVDPDREQPAVNRIAATKAIAIEHELGRITATVDANTDGKNIGRYFAIPDLPTVKDNRLKVTLPASLAAVRPTVTFLLATGDRFTASPEGGPTSAVVRDSGVVYVSDDSFDPGLLEGPADVIAVVAAGSPEGESFASQDGSIDVQSLPGWIKGMDSLTTTYDADASKYVFSGLMYGFATDTMMTPSDLPLPGLDWLKNQLEIGLKMTVEAPLNADFTPSLKPTIDAKLTLLGRELIKEKDSVSVGLDRSLDKRTLQPMGGVFGLELFGTYSTMKNLLKVDAILGAATKLLPISLIPSATIAGEVNMAFHLAFDNDQGKYKLLEDGTKVDVNGSMTTSISVKGGIYAPQGLGIDKLVEIPTVDKALKGIVQVSSRPGAKNKGFVLGVAAYAELSGHASIAMSYGFMPGGSGSLGWTKGEMEFGGVVDIGVQFFWDSISFQTIDLAAPNLSVPDPAYSDMLSLMFPGLVYDRDPKLLRMKRLLVNASPM